MTRKLVALKVRATQALASREAGQGTLEYVGMIALAALLVMAIVTAFGNGSSLATSVSNAITKITGIGG